MVVVDECSSARAVSYTHLHLLGEVGAEAGVQRGGGGEGEEGLAGVPHDGAEEGKACLLYTSKVYDRVTGKFSVEAFNLFNRTQFGAPDSGLGDGAFGVVTSQRNLPRVLQIAARLSF